MNIESTHRRIRQADVIGPDPDPAAQDAYAEGYRRGWDVATSRAISRLREGLEIEEPKYDE